MLLSNLEIFKRQLLILTATVSKMPVLRREENIRESKWKDTVEE